MIAKTRMRSKFGIMINKRYAFHQGLSRRHGIDRHKGGILGDKAARRLTHLGDESPWAGERSRPSHQRQTKGWPFRHARDLVVVNSTLRQEKHETSEKLEDAVESHLSGASSVGGLVAQDPLLN